MLTLAGQPASSLAFICGVQHARAPFPRSATMTQASSLARRTIAGVPPTGLSCSRPARPMAASLGSRRIATCPSSALRREGMDDGWMMKEGTEDVGGAAGDGERARQTCSDDLSPFSARPARGGRTIYTAEQIQRRSERADGRTRLEAADGSRGLLITLCPDRTNSAAAVARLWPRPSRGSESAP